jgi:hypothetical protein
MDQGFPAPEILLPQVRKSSLQQRNLPFYLEHHSIKAYEHYQNEKRNGRNFKQDKNKELYIELMNGRAPVMLSKIYICIYIYIYIELTRRYAAT